MVMMMVVMVVLVIMIGVEECELEIHKLVLLVHGPFHGHHFCLCPYFCP